MANLSKVLRPEGFPVLRERLDFVEYHESLAGNYIDVWLNPSLDFYDRWAEYIAAQGAQGKLAAAWRIVLDRSVKFQKKPEAMTAVADLLECTARELESLLSGGEADATAARGKSLLDEHEETVRVEQDTLYAELWGCTADEVRELMDTPQAGGFLMWLANAAWRIVREYREGGAKTRSDSSPG